MREIDAQTEKNHGITHSTTYSLMSQWRWWVEASAWAILDNANFVVLVHYLETAISIKGLSLLYSLLPASPSLINSISKPTVFFSLLVDFVFIRHLVNTSLSSFASFRLATTRVNYACPNPTWAWPKVTLGNSPVEYAQWPGWAMKGSIKVQKTAFLNWTTELFSTSLTVFSISQHK